MVKNYKVNEKNDNHYPIETKIILSDDNIINHRPRRLARKESKIISDQIE